MQKALSGPGSRTKPNSQSRTSDENHENSHPTGSHEVSTPNGYIHASPVVDIQCLFMDLQGFNLLPTDNKIVCQQLVSSSKTTTSVHPFPLTDCEQPPRNHGNHNGVEEVGDKCSLNAV